MNQPTADFILKCYIFHDNDVLIRVMCEMFVDFEWIIETVLKQMFPLDKVKMIPYPQ